MYTKRIIGILAGIIAVIIAMLGVLVHKRAHIRNMPEEIISKVEGVLKNEYKKQSMTELAATITYKKENGENEICYYVLRTTYFEKDPSEIVGLHIEALDILFPVDYMDSCEEMKIWEWPAALYKKGESAYLCWTYSPEFSYVLEYNPTVVQDSEIIRMAESVREWKGEK